jgi:hypothetical protein
MMSINQPLEQLRGIAEVVKLPDLDSRLADAEGFLAKKLEREGYFTNLILK